MASNNTAAVIESLAAEIGEAVYLDIAKWRLSLATAHLHEALASELYELMLSKTVSESTVAAVLQRTLIKVGGGRQEYPLVSFISTSSQRDLMDILEKFQREL